MIFQKWYAHAIMIHTNLVSVYIIDVVQLWCMLTSTIVSTYYVCIVSTISTSVLVIQGTSPSTSFIILHIWINAHLLDWLYNPCYLYPKILLPYYMMHICKMFPFMVTVFTMCFINFDNWLVYMFQQLILFSQKIKNIYVLSLHFLSHVFMTNNINTIHL